MSCPCLYQDARARNALGGPLTRVSDERRAELASLDKKLKSDIGAMVQELELKATFAEAQASIGEPEPPVSSASSASSS